MPDAREPLSFLRLTGRNGWDAPCAIPPDMAEEMVNVDLWDGGICRKRLGSTSLSLTFSSNGPFASGIYALFRHVPGASDTAAEFWAVDGSGQIGRLAGAATWTEPTLKDAISSQHVNWRGASLNGKLFMGYDSAVNRGHVWDPGQSSPSIRRMGLDRFAAAPTVGDTGAGAYAAVLRYYRVRNLELRSSVEYRRSEPSASVSFTPNGFGTHARITRPTAISEDETHWMIEVSSDNATWYELAGASGSNAVAIGTTTFDDNALAAAYTGYTAAKPAGYYTLPPSFKYIVSDGNRTIMAGAWETTASGVQTTPKNNRVWFTPVLGTTSAVFFDEERVPSALSDGTAIQSYVDLDENDSGVITGLAIFQNTIVVFKTSSIWALLPTGIDTRPYRRKRLNESFRIGAVNPQSICVGEDRAGNPALYFQSWQGPYRLGTNGLEFLGRDIMDRLEVWNKGASVIVSWMGWYAEEKKLFLNLATGSDTEPSDLCVFDASEGVPDDTGEVRRGWVRWSGSFASSRCYANFSQTVGVSMSIAQRPYVGHTTGTVILEGGIAAQASDNGTAYQGFFRSREIIAAPNQNFQTSSAEVLAEPAAAVTLQLSVAQDYGLNTTQTYTSAALTAAGSETKVFRSFGDVGVTMRATQITLGDASAVAALWVVDRLTVTATGQEARF